jgi:HlyD family secretion protein
MNRKMNLTVLLGLALILVSGCSSLNGEESTAIEATGTIAADDIAIASEIGGMVADVFVGEGDSVEAGDLLFRVDDQILQAQYDQASSALETAKAGVQVAKSQRDQAEAQYNLALQAARLQDIENRSAYWMQGLTGESDLPVWYFEKDERIQALQAEVDAAQEALERKLENLAKEIEDVSGGDFVAAEKRLAQAESAFEVAAQTRDQANAALDNVDLRDAAEEAYDAASAELESAQQEYESLLSTSEAEAILEARAEVAVARERLSRAHEALEFLRSGEQSLQVAAAGAALQATETGITQAEAGVQQAEDALALLSIQLEKVDVHASADGVVLVRNLEVGEIISPGGTVMRLGRLDEVSLTVYIPEDQYGRIQLGQEVLIKSDSFPAYVFNGEVDHIAEEAEFTPRNVQTVDGRKTTVFAIDITVKNEEGKLKPGMPVDVTFVED